MVRGFCLGNNSGDQPALPLVGNSFCGAFQTCTWLGLSVRFSDDQTTKRLRRAVTHCGAGSESTSPCFRARAWLGYSCDVRLLTPPKSHGVSDPPTGRTSQRLP